MAAAQEIGIGMASLLAMDAGPEPLPLSFRGQTLDEAGEIVLAILAECKDAQISLNRVEGDPHLCRHIVRDVHVPLRANPQLVGEMLFYRRE